MRNRCAFFLYLDKWLIYPEVMDAKGFKRWRKALGYNQKDAAEALGLKRRVVQYYEKGERDGKPVEIPLYVALACYALAQGVTTYHGPPDFKPQKRAKAPQKTNQAKTADGPVEAEGADASTPS